MPATSELAYFSIVDAKRDGMPLRPNTAVDANGVVTTDASAALDDTGTSNLLPIGGNYKGYNINYLFEIMTSALVGARVSAEMSADYIPNEHGGFIIAIAIDKITSRAQYDTSVKIMNEKVRAQKPAVGVEAVHVPGDSNLARLRATRDDTDIPLEDGLEALLLELAP